MAIEFAPRVRLDQTRRISTAFVTVIVAILTRPDESTVAASHAAPAAPIRVSTRAAARSAAQPLRRYTSDAAGGPIV
ncbi:hypothetical protein BJX68DRAFT_249050 [Aspergillus pseudodeflectus]|uniref:Uncharacterized protein n=1 Tax=Aspergillus pseudodeflectus TaxID=176178 RepID=A0ABR4JE61_9EURO